MCKNIVNIMFDNKLPENTVDMIMKFHKSIPDKINDKMKQCIKNDNYKLKENTWRVEVENGLTNI